MIVEPGHVNYSDRDLVTFLGRQESQDIHWGDRYEEALIDHLRQGPELFGARLPWGKTHDKIRLRPGEVSVWAGMNGHHKSMILGQVMAWIALHDDAPCGLMSFEMPVRDTMKRLLQQAAGSLVPGEAFARQWARWNQQHIAYYDKLDTTPSNRVLGAIFYMAKDLGCKHIMVDSLTKCGLPGTSGDRYRW